MATIIIVELSRPCRKTEGKQVRVKHHLNGTSGAKNYRFHALQVDSDNFNVPLRS